MVTMQAIDSLQAKLATQKDWAIAVSGGVDSMTLAYIACHSPYQRQPPTVLHALSPAVPPSATELVQQYAARYEWTLKLIDAGEYDDPRYRDNPVNRCYFCKTNLYARIRETTSATIASGTNTDDLGDYRPGLSAAEDFQVRHPYVEAGINKAMVREIARHVGLTEIAELPAQPCLASRVETGIAIDATDLQFVNHAEQTIRDVTGPGDIRCRISATGVHLQMEPRLISTQARLAIVDRTFDQICRERKRVNLGVRPYVKGSAFIQPPARTCK